MNVLRRGMGFERFSGLYLWGALILVFSIWQTDYFPTSATLHSVAADRSITAILGLAIIVPLACGAFDLSVGAVANFSTIISAILINDGWSWPVAAVAAVVISAGFGALNGLFVVRFHVSSFITTLGTASVITAVQVIATNNLQPVAPSIPSWSNFTGRPVFGFPIVFFYMLVIALVLWWVMEHTPVGRYLYAIGSSPDAARLSGAPVSRFTWGSLVVSSTLAGVAGVFFSSVSGPSLTYGAGLLLPAFAAAFLGSTQVVPGRFNVWGTVLAIYVLATGVKGLQLAYPDAQWLDPMFSGGALIVAVAVAVGRQRAGEERARKKLSRTDPRKSRKAPPPPTETAVPGESEQVVV